MQQSMTSQANKVPTWALAIFPLIILLLLVVLFFALNPLAFFTGAFPPLEELSIQRVTFPENGRIQLDVINGGPDPVTIAQVLVDDAYWQYAITPGNTLKQDGSCNTQDGLLELKEISNISIIGVGTNGPYRISLGSILPKKAECSNLIVPVYPLPERRFRFGIFWPIKN